MPANLTPEYEKAELRYRQATTDTERLACLQEMLSAIPKHKGTEKMQADLKRRISQFRREEQKSAQSRGPDPFHIPRSGAGQVVIVGPPNSGKSSLLAAATQAAPKVADYPFTTGVPQPGMWELDDVVIELVDTPPLTPEHVPAGLMGTIRNADVVCVLVEAGDVVLEQLETVLGLLRAKGLTLVSTPRSQLSSSGPGVCFLPGLIVLSKVDCGSEECVQAVKELYSAGPSPGSVRDGTQPGLEVVAISAKTGAGLQLLFGKLWELLAMIRVYSKEPGRPPDLHKPFTVPIGTTVEGLARQIHRDLPERLKFARLWGHSRFDGQQVHRTEVLQDKDVVELHE
jgi:ribosome-interacting GTPase 1